MNVTETLPVVEEVVQDLEKIKPNMILEGIKQMLPGLTHFAYNVLITLLIVLIGMRVIKSIRRWTLRSFERFGMDQAVGRFLSSCISALLYGVLIFVAAERLGVSSASIIALLGSAGIAISLSLQGSLSNFAGGVMILMLKPFQIGDYIVSASGEGTVTNIGIIYTSLQTIDNRVVIVPNGTLSNSPLTNVTASDKRRLIIPVGISYDADLKRAKEILLKLFTEDARIIQDDAEKPVEVFVDELSDSAVLLKARGWTKTEDYWQAKWSLTEQIKLSFDAEGIEIPYQQMDVHVKQ